MASSKESLIRRLIAVINELEKPDTSPQPYNLYRALKNDGEGTDWRYSALDWGITEFRQVISALLSQDGAREESEMSDAQLAASEKYLRDCGMGDLWRLPATFNYHKFYHAIMSTGTPVPDEAVEAGREALTDLIATAFRRLGGVAAIARSSGGARKLAEIAAREAIQHCKCGATRSIGVKSVCPVCENDEDWPGFTISNDQTPEEKIESIREGVRLLKTTAQSLDRVIMDWLMRVEDDKEVTRFDEEVTPTLVSFRKTFGL